MARKSLLDRIDEALAGKRCTYYELATRLWSPQSRSWRHATGGGPPGCFMALSSGLRRGKFIVIDHEHGGRTVYPRK